MKRRLTTYIFLIAAVAVVISTAIGIAVFRQRELGAAKQSLDQLLSFLDVQEADTDVGKLLTQFKEVSPDLRLTFIAQDGTVLGDTDADTA